MQLYFVCISLSLYYLRHFELCKRSMVEKMKKSIFFCVC